MYREPAPPEADLAPAPELLFKSVARGGSGKSGIAVLQLVAVPVSIGALAAVCIDPTVGLVVMILVGALGIYALRRMRRGRDVVLRIDDGVLRVLPPRPGLAEVSLDALADVALDTKTVKLVTDGNSAIPAMRIIDSRVGPEVDRARIVLQTIDGRSAPLDDAYLAHMDATEWLGKIRVFLRKHGWVPEDERDGPSSEAS